MEDKIKCIKVSGEDITGFTWQCDTKGNFDFTTCDGFLEEEGDEITLKVVYLTQKEFEDMPEYEGE